jgi:tryptophan synthase alpha chain
MTRIGRLFENLKRDGRKALIAYLTVGDPSPERTPALVEALVRGGADLIELGVPFSDPIADGPVIQAAGERALKAGTTLKRVLQVAAEIRRKSEVPLLLFTYLNPVVRYGLENLARDAAAAGIDGCLLTDASVEEARDYVAAMHRYGLDTVFLAAPTSTERRLRLVAEYSTGFVYLVSRTGVTGERDSLSASVAPLVAAVRAVTGLPLAVGFGISRPEHVAALGRQVEAVVVGSAIVRLIERNAGNASLEIQLESFARELKHGFGAQE